MMNVPRFLKAFFISSMCLVMVSSCCFNGDYVSKLGDSIIHVNTTTSDDDSVVLPLLGIVSFFMLIIASIPSRFKVIFTLVALLFYCIQSLMLGMVSFDAFWSLAWDTVVYGNNTGMLLWIICFGLYSLSVVLMPINLIFPFELWLIPNKRDQQR